MRQHLLSFVVLMASGAYVVDRQPSGVFDASLAALPADAAAGASAPAVVATTAAGANQPQRPAVAEPPAAPAPIRFRAVAYIPIPRPRPDWPGTARAIIAPVAPPPAQSAPSQFTSAATPRQVAGATTAGGRYRDGTYKGSVANAYYGLVQVEAVVRNGRLADVHILRYPNDRSTSRHISGRALPVLERESIARQTADVDIVSGATLVSRAYRTSLHAALDQAQA
jgi:uncharacterized protein with FMN-binding domain